jgi:hypothetical protein
MRAMRCATWMLVAACGSHAVAPAPAPAPAAVKAPAALARPSDFAAIPDRAARSAALFSEISRVLTHPRCVNCHTPDESPRQGDLHALHDPPVARGTADRGVPAMLCTGCHQDRNLPLARVPGAPGWQLAPTSMVWLDRSPHDICEQLLDRARNGGRTLEQVRDHVAHDRLVGWGWSPGADRTPAPGSQAELAALVDAWITTGTRCPSS